MKNILTLTLGMFLCTQSIAQSQDSVSSSGTSIAPVTEALAIKEYIVYNFRVLSLIQEDRLDRFSNTNILSAVNTQPGIRMEERSPGSFRFGIRGSASGAPFGVRNIKAYYNDIPITDAGGNTYLNQFGFYNMRQIAVKMGPSGSLYGAGIGGVLFLGSFPNEVENTTQVHYSGGSFGSQNVAIEVMNNENNRKQAIRYQHNEAQGYRKNSASKHDVFSYDGTIKAGEKNELSAHFLYSDLTYQTPGGLTLAQYNTDPTNSRPGTATIPGAIDNKATVYQKSFLAGITNKLQMGNYWTNKLTVFASYNQLINPTIRNYSRSYQPNVGGRTTFQYDRRLRLYTLQWIIGAELLKQFVTEKTYQNNLGTPGNLTNDLEFNNTLALGFTHLEWKYKKWTVLGGISVNNYYVNVSNFMPTYVSFKKQYNNEVAPRLSLQYNIIRRNVIFAQVEKGYTPPSISELSPTGSNINLTLQASKGWNYAIGTTGFLWGDRLLYSVQLFNFRMSQAIAQRRDSAGGDYYVNSGGANQYGIEAGISYDHTFRNKNEFLTNILTTLSYTGYDFRYKDFTQLTTDFSNKKLPGVPDHVVSLTTDLKTRIGLYANLTYYYCSSIFLNDANTDKAVDYTLLGGRIGYKKNIKRILLNVYAGGDNLLDKKYSLGNDINAAGGRYYNAAPGINFFAGISLGYKYKKLTPPPIGSYIMEIRD